jgi:hypothetical protein
VSWPMRFSAGTAPAAPAWRPLEAGDGAERRQQEPQPIRNGSWNWIWPDPIGPLSPSMQRIGVADSVLSGGRVTHAARLDL